MRFLTGSRLGLLTALTLACGVASANDIYVAQASTGAANGQDCTNAKASSF